MIHQYLGYSGSGLTRRAKELAKQQGAAYVSSVAEDHLSYVRSTVIEEIAVGMEHRGVDREEMQQRCERIAQQLGITHLLERDPLTLSGGELRKLTIATVLVLEPANLVLDDPFAGLDHESATDLRELLATLPTTVTLFSTHQHYPDLPVTLIGDDPRTPPQLPARVPVQTGVALDVELTGTRGTKKKWLRPARTDFHIGPVHIQVPASGLLWLRGPNGSGKTTLLRALADRDDCAYMVQDPYDALIHTTVGAMAPEPWLSKLALDATVHPFDLSTTDMKLAQLGAVLGTGRLILLLDEPDVGLDPRGTTLFLQALSEHLAAPGAGAVLVSHQEEFAELCSAFAPVKQLVLE